MVEISLFIPVFNEEKILRANLLKVYKKLKSMRKSFEIIVADDGSLDSTPCIVKKLSKNFKEIKLFRNEMNMGRGEVLNSSFKTARGKYIIFMDVDLATDLEYLPILIQELSGADIATGSRWLSGSEVERSIFRLFVSIFYNKLVSIMFGSNIKDHQCGFKGFKRNVILRLSKESGIRKDRSWAWDTEILIRAQFHEYKISEFPVKWNEGKQTKFKFLKDIVKVGFYLIKLFFRFKKERKLQISHHRE